MDGTLSERPRRRDASNGRGVWLDACNEDGESRMGHARECDSGMGGTRVSVLYWVVSARTTPEASPLPLTSGDDLADMLFDSVWSIESKLDVFVDIVGIPEFRVPHLWAAGHGACVLFPHLDLMTQHDCIGAVFHLDAIFSLFFVTLRVLRG
jgi:hypothetical protein